MKRLTWLTCLLCLLLLGCSREETLLVPVMIEDGAGFAAVGDNPLYVPVGEDAEIPISLRENTVVLGCDGAYWDDARGVLRLTRVLYPTTVRLRVGENTGYGILSLHDRMGGGTIRTSASPGESIPLGREITVTAEPKNGYVFHAWTRGATLAHGGESVSVTPEYVFSLSGDTALYANYRTAEEIAEDAARVMGQLIYNANGGTVAETGETVLYQDVDLTDFRLPNSLPERGYFTREGYVLLEYNTKADGTGDAYSLGSKIILPEGESGALLYCIWAAESDASLFKVQKKKTGTLAVTAYLGDEDTVVIPARIDGIPVDHITGGAFREKSFTTLVLPETVRTVDHGAFIGCRSFTTLYMCDTVEQIFDDSFERMENFAHFRLNAAMEPRYAGTQEGNFCRKWERLVTTQDQNRIVVVSGSSSLAGLKSPQMEAYFGGDYAVVNYGTNAGTASTFYMEVCAPFLHEGDILVQAPCTDAATQLGSNEITWRLFRAVESYYNVFRCVDMRHYTKLFSSYVSYNESRKNMRVTAYTDLVTTMDDYGDVVAELPLNREDFNLNPVRWLDPNRLQPKWAENLARVHRTVEASGARVYFSYGISNINIYHPDSLTPEYIAKVDAGYDARLSVPRISTIIDYIFEGEYHTDADAHLGAEGRRIRTERLSRDIEAQLIRDGIRTP